MEILSNLCIDPSWIRLLVTVDSESSGVLWPPLKNISFNKDQVQPSAQEKRI